MMKNRIKFHHKARNNGDAPMTSNQFNQIANDEGLEAAGKAFFTQAGIDFNDPAMVEGLYQFVCAVHQKCLLKDEILNNIIHAILRKAGASEAQIAWNIYNNSNFPHPSRA